ncbi:MAG: bacterioferritin [Candidatus Sumerlaeota bacterium]|nr:bacterioferritin [Candidatus Sumerlaeota bacterium]
MSQTELIAGLNEALNRELSTIIRYMLQGSMIKGRQNQSLRAMYREEVTDEIGHAQYLADKIVMLGGTPKVSPDLTPPPDDVARMIENDLAKELSDVAHYKKLADLAEKTGDIELKMQMEEQAADESRHADELRRMI